MGYEPWTATEDQKLREHYPAKGALGLYLSNLLPGRTRASIARRANQFRLEMKPAAKQAMHRRKQISRKQDPTPEEIHRRCEAIRAEREVRTLQLAGERGGCGGGRECGCQEEVELERREMRVYRVAMG